MGSKTTSRKKATPKPSKSPSSKNPITKKVATSGKKSDKPKKAEPAVEEAIDFSSFLSNKNINQDFFDADLDTEFDLLGQAEDSETEDAKKEDKLLDVELEHSRLVAQEKNSKVTKKNNKLPIKDSKGQLVLAKDIYEDSCSEEEDAIEQEQHSEVSDLEDGTSEFEGEEAGAEPENNLPIKSKAYLKLKLEELAKSAQHFLEDPESNYFSLKPLKLLSADKNMQVRKFALLTQLSVFKDVLPSYRIRALSQEERKVRVTKEVYRLRSYEEYLVSSYLAFLKTLTNQFKVATNNPNKYVGLRHVSSKCLAELLVSKPNFNFSDILFEFVARRLATTYQDSVYTTCLDAATRLFKEDDLGQNSCHLVQALTKSIKHKMYRVAPDTIRVFLYLKFNTDLLKSNSEPTSEKNGNKYKRPKMTLDLTLNSERREHISRKKKQRAKAQKAIDNEMREAEAEYTTEERSKVQTELLKNIFVIYFRVLKHSTTTTLFPVTLEGLSRFGHLISIDFFSDLLSVLKSVLKNGLVANSTAEANQTEEDGEEATHTSVEVVRCKLLCVLTAFKLLSGQGEVLNLDLKDFYCHLYGLLPVAANFSMEDISTVSRPGEFIVPTISALVVDCVDALFFRYRKDRVSLERAAAFFKRIVSLSYQFQPNTSVRLLNLAKAFIVKYPGLVRMFSTEEAAGDGEFLPFSPDPDMSNVFATSVFELPGLLHLHYDPAVRVAANNLLKVALSR